MTLKLVCGTCMSPMAARAADQPAVRGSTKGLMNETPVWSAGLQIGNGGSTGPVVQRFGIWDGAVNAGIGFDRHDLAVTADWLALMDEDFSRVHPAPGAGYNPYRGRLMPYIGGGMMVGPGIAFRVPAGVQYTMLRDPFNFFAGGALTVGHYFEKDELDLGIWAQIGARLPL